MRALALLTALAATVAGCTAVPSPSSEPPAGAPEAGPTVLPWGLQECTFLIGLVRFDPAEAQDLLPPGFAFAEGDGLPLPVEAEPLSGAILGVEAFACEAGAGLDGPVAPLAYGSVYFNVIPPPELSAGEDAGHYLKLRVLVPDAPRRAVLEAAGADVTDGTVDLARDATGMAGTMTLASEGDVAFTALQVRPLDGVEGLRFREFTPTADGRLVQWDGVARSPGTFSGRGVLEVPEGSIPARLGGGTPLAVGMFGGVYTFENATITLPPPASP